MSKDQLTAEQREEADGEQRWILAGEHGAVEGRGYRADAIKFIAHPAGPLHEEHEQLSTYCPILEGPCWGFYLGLNLHLYSARRNEPWDTLAALYQAKLAR